MTKLIELIEAIGKNMRSLLALLFTIGSFGYLFTLLFIIIPVGNATIVNVAAGLVLGGLTGITSYYFGSSKDKSDADKASIAKDMSKTNDTPILSGDTETNVIK